VLTSVISLPPLKMADAAMIMATTAKTIHNIFFFFIDV
jgi:hypothetical protein